MKLFSADWSDLDSRCGGPKERIIDGCLIVFVSPCVSTWRILIQTAPRVLYSGKSLILQASNSFRWRQSHVPSKYIFSVFLPKFQGKIMSMCFVVLDSSFLLICMNKSRFGNRKETLLVSWRWEYQDWGPLYRHWEHEPVKDSLRWSTISSKSENIRRHIAMPIAQSGFVQVQGKGEAEPPDIKYSMRRFWDYFVAWPERQHMMPGTMALDLWRADTDSAGRAVTSKSVIFEPRQRGSIEMTRIF